MPVYDENGEIRGLLGYFIDKELLTVNDARGAETKRRDLLTGLLNSRGISEEAHAFQDEYYLRNTDFARYHVAINDFSALNRQYGFDFADKAMARLGTELKKAFGRTSAVGRYGGSHFAILRQVKSAEEAHELRNRIREIAAHIRRIDGVPVTLYLSVGYTLYSECENLDEQRQKTEVRLLANQDERASAESRQQRASEIFHVYDDLPISFAVCRVVTDESGKVIDTVVFYVNHKFEDGVGKKAAELLGCRTRELFPSLGEDWYEKVGRAALRGETVIGRLYYTPNGKTYYMTANQVIHPGYFSVTYQEMDLLERLGEK
jgi:diguanylate cyclase (GGDEF)-like protein/PAS domain S-box-containing protein